MHKTLVTGVFVLITVTGALCAGPVAVTTHHNDFNRTGVNPNETTLTTSNVNVSNFGKLFSRTVDGQIYAQPLYVPNVAVAGQGVHNVVYVCTEHNSVYAFDADSSAASNPLWHVNFGPSLPSAAIPTIKDLLPEIGITSTPIIDLSSNTLYVVAETYENSNAIFRLHALDITSGAEKFNGPIVIQGSVSGTGGGSVNGVLAFNPFMHWQRPGLLLWQGNLYIGFGSHQDDHPYHGWLFEYNATTLQQVAIRCLSPNAESAGVWQAGVGLTVDANGFIYVHTGDGPLDANTGGQDFGDSLVKLDTNNGLAIVDYFSPSNQAALFANDVDFGSSSPLLIPGTSLGVSGGKDGKLFLYNTNNLGQFHSTDQVIQEWQATYSLLGTGAGGFFAGNIFYNSTLYVWGRRDILKAFAFNGSTFNTTPVSQSTFAIPDGYSNEPAMSLSANGTTPGTGILWVAYSANGPADGYAYPGILRALDASDVSRELWNSNLNSTRDSSGSWAKWCPPTIANGKVYVGTFDNVLNVYGLLGSGTSGSGSLLGSGSSDNTALNLTTEGGADWVHWGDASLNRKAGVTGQLSSYTMVGTGTAATYSNDPRPLNWTDGTPTASATNDTNGVYVGGLGSGFSFTASADTSSRTLMVHAGGFSSGGTLTAHLSDGSASDFVDTTAPVSGQYDRNYTLSYNAGSAGQTLTVTWKLASGSGNVTLNGAALAVISVPASITATGGTPQSATVSTAFATALQATVKDAGNNPVSGVTVTFSAPATGASGAFSGSATATTVTNSSGVATAPSFTANAAAGSYTVAASVSGVATSASFNLTNTAGAAASITATGGTPQSATVSTAFGSPLKATVKDAGNNPVSGVTVTFSAPATGASGAFSGSATATAVTNGSGVATAPTFTANAAAGSYTVAASVSGVATSASFNLTNTAVVTGAGSLAGSGNSTNTVFNLTTEGTADWVHWGDASLNRKAGVTAQLSSYTVVGTGPVRTYGNDPRPLSWTDGAPTASGTNNTNGVYVGIGNGFSFTAPADPSSRTLVVHVGGFSSGGTLTAHLSDGSAADFVDTTVSVSGQYDRNYTLSYNAGAAGQTLTVTWKLSAGTGNVTLNGAALAVNPVPASITATGGTPQSATVSTAFGTALQATVKDAGNNPVSGVTVTFSAPATGASGAFSGSATATAVTNGSGVATAPTFTANATAGSYTVAASVSGVATSASFNLTNTAGAASSITATGGTPQSATVSTAFGSALQATVKDAGNNPVSGVTVTFSAPATGASGAFSGSATATAVTNSSGVATAPAFTANATAGSYTVAASVSGVATSASFNLTNTAGAASSITATGGTPQSATVSTAFGSALQATVKDAGNNPVSGVTVTFSAPATGASGLFGALATATAVTNSSGVATAPAFTANATAGSYTVAASVAGVATSASFNLTNTAGAAASITATGGTPQSATVSTAFATALKATVKDAGNNPVSGVTVTFSAPATGASGLFGALATATAVTNGSGVATAPAFTANATAGSYTVAASVSGVATSASFNLTNTAGAAASISATGGTPQSATVSTAFGTVLQATVKDAGNNPVSGVTVTFSAPATGASGLFGALATATAVTNGSGVATAPTFTANATAGSYTVAASVSGVATSASFNLTNTAGAASSITATGGTPQSATVSTAFATAPQATVKDAGNNPVSGVTVTFSAPATGASGAFSGSATATAVTNGSGVATAPAFTANATAGSYTVAASVSGVATSASFNLTNTAGAAASISATGGTPQSATVSTAFGSALKATVKDAGSNPVSGVTVTFSAPATGASGLFGALATATAVTNGSGVATAPTFTANATAGSYTVAASVSGVATSASFNLTNTAGAAASITATGGTPQSATVSTAFGAALQATVKDAGNNPVSGVTVTFSAPATGASGAFSGSATATAATNSSGVATAPAFTANATAGSYTVAASVSGVATSASFNLTNTAGAAASITATGGTPQSATVSTAFGSALKATVKDAGNNPVSGVTVTFSAPATGASGAFSGSATATAVTNGSGVATAPAFTANATVGSYTVAASVSGVATSASFNLTNTAVVTGAGSLAGSGNSTNTVFNLTTEGTADWVHWGDASLNRKAGVTAQLSSYTVVGNGPVQIYGNDPRPLSWADGAPTASGTNNTNGVYVGIGNGFSFTAPADPSSRTLVVHVGGFSSGGTLTAHLSDGSAADFVDTTVSVSGQYDRNYTLSYNAGAAGQTLTVTWKLSAGTGNVTLNGAALAVNPVPASITATGGTPQSATVSTAFGTALQATVKDAGNNPVSGVTVTFSAPATGASGAFSGSATATAVTNGSGVATAPAFTANATVGSYTVAASVSGVATSASFNLTNTAVVTGAGSLAGSGNSTNTVFNLTTEGTADWVHWGDASLNRKAGVTAQLSSYTVVGNGPVQIYGNDPRPLSWADGAPTASGTNNTNGVYVGIGNGFSFTAPADPSSRTLVVHVGGFSSGGTLTAHLSDGSAADFVDTTVSVSGQYDRNYTLSYNAGAAGQTLTVTWKLSAGTGNVTLNGAALR